MPTNRTKPTWLRFPAIRVQQTEGKVLFTFAVDGKVLSQFAAISRIHRTGDNAVVGYQRPEVQSHIAQIRSYIESESPMIPNAVVVAFDSRVKFKPLKGDGVERSPYSQPGTLTVPVDASWGEDEKPGFVVDGQQRLAAIRDADINVFPVCVTAFVTDDVHEQAEQFILVNSTKPLPKGLIYELLPGTAAQLPTLLHRRRFPAMLVERLNYDDRSPLKGLIQTPTNPHGIVKDNSILRMLENSLTDGALYRYRDPETGEGDLESMLQILFEFWSAVAEVFPRAWAKPPKRSRLMHGAGIAALGFVMDAIADRHRRKGVPTREQFIGDLRAIEHVCRWDEGHWEFGPGMERKWNEVQNTSKDIALLTNYLLHQYRALVRSGTRKNGRQVELPI
jgi:DGQHR domain-containing protein